jgi:RNA polymerase sigma-70 factor, ECF subfamily
MNKATLAAMNPEAGARAHPAVYLSEMYRDYPGLHALILRRARDPELAADILQDAAVTTLEKLRRDEIAQPEKIGGYLYRVAINHLRNLRRMHHATRCMVDVPEEELTVPQDDPEWDNVGRLQWAQEARRLLEEMPAARDREVLVRFYLHDEPKEAICRDLRLTGEHFNRVIFRARNRFRELLERRGYGQSDFLTIVAYVVCLSAAANPPV